MIVIHVRNGGGGGHALKQTPSRGSNRVYFVVKKEERCWRGFGIHWSPMSRPLIAQFLILYFLFLSFLYSPLHLKFFQLYPVESSHVPYSHATGISRFE